MKLVKRDYDILENIYKFGFCLSRHVHFLAHFPSARTTDRRLKILVDSGYLERQRLIYGVPYIYFLTKKGKGIINKVPREEKIRLDIINHNIVMIDYLPYLIENLNLSLDDMLTEKELHSIDSFSVRKHHPDLAFINEHKKVAVEIELTAKSRERLKANIQKNYLDYDYQIWIVPTKETKILNWLNEEKKTYTSLGVIKIDR